MENYNGWANYETWNVALWIGNDEGLYNLAISSKNYEEFKGLLSNEATGDDVLWNDSKINVDEINLMIEELDS